MDLKNKKVLVFGAGKSGIGAANLLIKLGAEPVIFDEKKTPANVLKELERPEKAEAVSGEMDDSLVKSLDLAVLSPGVPCDSANVIRLKKAGVPIWGEIELAYRAAKGRVLAITGTNGKTTTTTLLGEIMKAAVPEVFVVGNIGNPYTDAALKTTEKSTVVAEISSFQLETIHEFHPAVSAILNITEDHLNRHHTMQEYIRVKELITANQTDKDTCVLNYEDDVLRKFGEKACPARVAWFSSKRKLAEGYFLEGGIICRAHDGKTERIVDTDKLILIGTHNFENVMAAAAMAEAAGVDTDTIRKVCESFKPVPHRIEYVATKHGVRWYNDSKGTNPDAAIKGIEAMKWPTFLIAGGYDKGSDYDPWIHSFGGRVKKLVLEGKTKDDIRAAAVKCGFPESDIVMCSDMHEAMDYCRDHAADGDAVLLSPACASWGEFPNYEVRGDEFKAYVRNEVSG